MIHHVNKITEADFQTVTGFRHGRIQYVEKEPKILRSSQTHFLPYILPVLTYFAQILLF